MSSISTSTTSTQTKAKLKPLIHNPIFPWSKVKILENGFNPFPRFGHSTCSSAINDELYFFGGVSNEKYSNHVFLMETNTYSIQLVKTTGNIPSPRSRHTHARAGSNLIVFGGKLENTDKPDYNLYVLNLVTKKWKKPSIKGVTPLGRFGHSAVSIGSVMYVFGGCIDGYYLSDLVAFDTKLLSSNESCWEFIYPINEPPPGRAGHISCAYDGKIYIFGGTDGERCYNDTWYYDTSTKEWVELTFDTFTPIPRESHGSTLVNDVLFVFGGRTLEGQELSDLAAFGINNTRWYMFQKMGPTPNPRYWLSLSSSKEMVMVFGGESSKSKKRRLDEEGFIHILDTSKIKYPNEPYPTQSDHSQLQMILSTFPQQKSLPKLRQQQINDDREIIEEYEDYNISKTELKARNPDIRTPSSSSRPTSRIVNINIATTSGRHSSEKDSIRSRPSSIIDLKKSANQNEKTKKSKTSSKKDVSSEKETNNIQNNSAGISSEEQMKNTKQKNLYINTGETGSTISLMRLSTGNDLKRQNSTDSIRSVRSIQSIRSITTLSSPSLRPKGARTLERKNKVKLDETSRNISSPIQKEISSPSKVQAAPLEKEVPLPSKVQAAPLEKEVPSPSKVQTASPKKEVPSLQTVQAASPKKEVPSPPKVQSALPEKEVSKPPPVRPPRRRMNSEPIDISKRDKLMHNDSSVPNTPILTRSTRSLRIPITSSDGRYLQTTQLSSLERENFLERLSEADFKISEMRKREKLYQAEIDLARKAGYIPTFSFNEENNEDVENIIDIKKFIDVGEPGSEKFKVIEAIIKLSQQLQKAKETITNQERVTSQKIADFERLYTASLEETAYFKAKFAALLDEYEMEKLSRNTDDVKEIKQKLNEKTQKWEESSKGVEDAKNKFEHVLEAISDKTNTEPNIQGIISLRFREIATRCDELEALHEIAHKELQASLSKHKKSVKNAQEALSLESTLENATVKSQKQLVDIKNRLSQVESDYQVAVEYTASTEQILDKMKEELIQSKLEMEKLNEKLINVENYNEKLENRLKELQNSMNSHSNIRNSIMQEYADQQLTEQQMNYEKEKESLHQQIQDLQIKIHTAQDEKSLMDQGYEALRRIYESLRNQNEILKRSNDMLTKQSFESGKKEEELKNELMKKVNEYKLEEEEKEDEELKIIASFLLLEDKETLTEKDNLATVEHQEETEQQKWEQEKILLEQKISAYQESNENLEKSNSVLKKNVNDSESKIAVLLDQMENVVDTYRDIEDNIREGSPALIGPVIRNIASLDSLKQGNLSDSDAGSSSFSLN